MTTFYPILVTARYEIKILLRSWFFLVFSALVLAGIILLNVVFFALPQYSRWMYYGIPAGIPYMNLMLINLAQAVIGIFIASDFLKNDYKLDSTDVIYVRSMPNISYIIGKVMGLLVVFGVLNLIVLCISFVFNVFFVEMPVIWVAYVIYPLLISLPTLLFVIGLSISLMVIFRNQALTIILLLGYCLTTIFFLSQTYDHLFDYMAFNVPMMYSAFIGFGNISQILVHRAIYFLLGTGLLFFTILKLQRPRQSRFLSKISFSFMVFCFCGVVFLGVSYITGIDEGKDLRSGMSELDSDFTESENITPISCSLELVHQGSEIAVEAAMNVINETNNTIDRYIFSLNPGLTVTEVNNGSEYPFSRDTHILIVTPIRPLQPGMTDSFTIVYEGAINEDACYYTVDENIRAEKYSYFMYPVDKRYSILEPEYVLLTPNTMWYPAVKAFTSVINTDSKKKHFIRFNLNVKTAPHLTALSQGAVTNTNPGEFEFHPEVLLPQISLVIGDYDSRSVTVDGTEYAIYFMEGHDYFSEFFEDPELISDEISNIRWDYENLLGLRYPYQRLMLVETPINFYAFPNLLTSCVEYIQPEQILLPEKGVLLANADFRYYSLFIEREMSRGRGVMSPEDANRNLFRRFIDNTFLGENSQSILSRLRRTRTGLLSKLRILELTYTDNEGLYSIFPMVYSHVYHFSSQKWPLFNTAVEYYFLGRIGDPSEDVTNATARGGGSNITNTGLSEQEMANNALAENSLFEFIQNPDKIGITPEVLKHKCMYLFSLFEFEFGKESFETFLGDYFYAGSFSDHYVDDFLAELESNFGIDLKPVFDSWLHQKKLPAFIIDDVDCYGVLHGAQTRYQVMFNVYNPEPVDGLMHVAFSTVSRVSLGGRFGRAVNEGEFEKIIRIEGEQTKKIGILLDGYPIGMTMNTLISQNLPSVLQSNFRPQLNEEAEPFEEEIILDDPISLTEPGAVIVDNEDPGFFVHSIESERFFKRLFDTSDENEYIQINFRNLPKSWKAVMSGDYYGAFRHSAHFIKSGDGGNKASWKAQLEQNGQYEIYYYVAGLNALTVPMRLSGVTQGGQALTRENYQAALESIVQDFHFNIHHDGGVEEVKLDADKAEVGWNLLGTFYFSKGEATVELTDQTDGQLVYADAVKWIIRQ